MRFLTSHDFEPLYDRLLTQFNAPLDIVNAAAFEIINVCAARQLADQAIETTMGAVRYSIRWPNGDAAWIYVQKRAEALTSITIHPCVPRNGPQQWHHIETARWAAELMSRVGHEILQVMRITNPEFTLQPVAGLTPPMPSWNDDPLVALMWKTRYAQNMSDQEFADELGISTQTLWNAKSKYGLTRTPRGKTQPKVGKKR
jgi:hypothetical protein